MGSRIFKVRVYEFDLCFSPNFIWADEEDSTNSSMSLREDEKSKSHGQIMGTYLCNSKDGREEVEKEQVDVQILVDYVRVLGVDFKRSSGIEPSATGFSNEIFNDLIDSCNSDACNQMQDVSFITTATNDGSFAFDDEEKRSVSIHGRVGGVSLLLCPKVGAGSGENKPSVQEDWRHVDGPSRALEDTNLLGRDVPYVEFACESEDSRFGYGHYSTAEVAPIIHVIVSNNSLSWEESVDMANNAR
ncbi:hypothetical protein V6N13_041400 [Hibiscus sabdariffa]|uniref:Uncharacterized protein n=1 Tax=Hibiscus sabdariffa TaxID=183260 RepID=A0ABR2RB70_9ROSI